MELAKLKISPDRLQKILMHLGVRTTDRCLISKKSLESIIALTKLDITKRVNIYKAFNVKSMNVRKTLHKLSTINYIKTPVDTLCLEVNLERKEIFLTTEFLKLIVDKIFNTASINKISEDSAGLINDRGNIQINSDYTYDNFVKDCSEINNQDTNFSFSDFKEYKKDFDSNIEVIKNSEQLRIKNLNKIVKISNIAIIDNLPISDSIAFDYEGSNISGQTQRITQTEYNLITTSYKFFDLLDGTDKSIPKQNFSPITTFSVYYSNCYLNSSVEKDQIETENIVQVQSFEKLDKGYYNLYGFFKLSEKNTEFFVVIHAEKTAKNKITKDSILNQKGKCNFHKYVNFIYEHANRSGRKYGIRLLKRRGQSYILMLALTHLIHSCYNKRCHTILIGGQDKGKSHITSIVCSMYYKSVEIVESDYSRAGLLAAAGQTIITPNKVLTNQVIYGSFSSDCTILEEYMDSYDKTSSEDISVMKAIKTGATKSSVKMSKAGTTLPIPFNSTMIITGNYQPGKIQHDIDIAIKYAYQIKKTTVESANSIGEISDENLLNDQIFSNVTNPELEKLFVTKDLTDTSEQDPILGLSREYLIKTYSAKNEDYRTGFPNPVMKRFLFNVIGTFVETGTTDNEEISSTGDGSDSDAIPDTAKFDMHIPNLQNVLKEILDEVSFSEINENKRILYLTMLLKKYNSFVKTVGFKTADKMLVKVYNSVCRFNNETEASDDSKEIIERWLYMQQSSLNVKLINQFVDVRKKYGIIWEHEK